MKFELNLQYVPSKLNEADEPPSRTESVLAVKTGIVEKAFGPHIVDFMATYPNSIKD